MDWGITYVSDWTVCVATANFVHLPIDCPLWRLYQDASINISSCEFLCSGMSSSFLSSVHLGVRLPSHVTSTVLHHTGNCQAGYHDFTPSPIAWVSTSLHLHKCLLPNHWVYTFQLVWSTVSTIFVFLVYLCVCVVWHYLGTHYVHYVVNTCL